MDICKIGSDRPQGRRVSHCACSGLGISYRSTNARLSPTGRCRAQEFLRPDQPFRAVTAALARTFKTYPGRTLTCKSRKRPIVPWKSPPETPPGDPVLQVPHVFPGAVFSAHPLPIPTSSYHRQSTPVADPVFQRTLGQKPTGAGLEERVLEDPFCAHVPIGWKRAPKLLNPEASCTTAYRKTWSATLSAR